jgi:hypothetical protein
MSLVGKKTDVTSGRMYFRYVRKTGHHDSTAAGPTLTESGPGQADCMVSRVVSLLRLH